jgi:hypothetical protein
MPYRGEQKRHLEKLRDDLRKRSRTRLDYRQAEAVEFLQAVLEKLRDLNEIETRLTRLFKRRKIAPIEFSKNWIEGEGQQLREQKEQIHKGFRLHATRIRQCMLTLGIESDAFLLDLLPTGIVTSGIPQAVFQTTAPRQDPFMVTSDPPKASSQTTAPRQDPFMVTSDPPEASSPTTAPGQDPSILTSDLPEALSQTTAPVQNPSPEDKPPEIQRKRSYRYKPYDRAHEVVAQTMRHIGIERGYKEVAIDLDGQIPGFAKEFAPNYRPLPSMDAPLTLEHVVEKDKEVRGRFQKVVRDVRAELQKELFDR